MTDKLNYHKIWMNWLNQLDKIVKVNKDESKNENDYDEIDNIDDDYHSDWTDHTHELILEFIKR